MAELSYISTGSGVASDIPMRIPAAESVGGMLFDISGFENPFIGYPLLYHSFGNGAVVCINNMDDAERVGIVDNGFLGGLLYYHVSQYYRFLDRRQALYICIADCSGSWDAVQTMQRMTNGKLFQIGVWTSQAVWREKEDGSIGFTPLITDLQVQADELCGKIGEKTALMTPLNVVLCGGRIETRSETAGNGGGPATEPQGAGRRKLWRYLPDAKELGCAKVSVVLGQNGIEEVHEIQGRLPENAPVGLLGITMACLSECGAEESIAALQVCDLNKDEELCCPELSFGGSVSETDRHSTLMSDINTVWRSRLSMYGYIFPVDYDGYEMSFFFSSDQTLSGGDYCTIANNRIMHKCRRAACTALLPYVNSHHIYEPGTRNISVSSIAFITDSINRLIDSELRNRRGFSQIGGRVVTIVDNGRLLEDDSIGVRLEIKPVNYSAYIEEEVAHEVE